MNLRALQLSWLALVLLVGCATLATFNSRLAAGYATVAEVRETATTLLEAGVITVDEAQNVQRQADRARAGLELARDLHEANPDAGFDKLEAALTILAAAETWLQERQP